MYPAHAKHKKHKHHKKHSSSSSSSSSDSDDDRKRWKKEQKKLKKLAKKGMLPPGQYPAPAGAYPGAGYPTGTVVPPSQPYGGMHPPAGAVYPHATGYPAGSTGAPPFMAPPAGSYPGQQPFPGQQYPGQQAHSGQQYPGQQPHGGQQYPGQQPYPGSMGAPIPPPTGPDPFQAPPGGASYSGQPGVTPYGDSPFVPPGGPPSSQPYSQPAPGGFPGQAPVGSSSYPGQMPPAGQVPMAGGYPGQAPPPAGSMGFPGQMPPAGQVIPAAGYPGHAPPTGGHQGQAPPPATYQVPVGGVPAGQVPPGNQQLLQDFEKMKVYGTAERFEGTVKPAKPFNVESDAEILRKAMKGLGTDEAAIINLISQRSNTQRQEIKKMFKTMYGKDLIKDLESELSGDFRETIMSLFVATTYYDAWTLHNAMEGLGTKESVLIEILCTRTNAEIKEITKCYKEHFRRDLEKDIIGDTSGHFKRLLISCSQGNRAELTEQQWQQVFQQGPESITDRNLAIKDAGELYQAGEKKWGTDESTFLKIMAIRHFYQLRATFEEYTKVAQRDILNSIDREMSGDLKEGFKALVMSARSRPEYFADKLYRSMKGAGTDDSMLIRIVVSRSEIDMVNIKKVFLQKYQKTLSKFIEGDTSGDYKRILIGIVGRN